MARIFKTHLLLLALGLLTLSGCNKDESDPPKFDTEDLTGPVFPIGVEGPATDSLGNLYAMNYGRSGTIGKITPSGDTSLFVSLLPGSHGNGLRFDSRGDMVVADQRNRQLLKVKTSSRSVRVFARDDRMHEPNDIAITDNDICFISAPDFPTGSGQIWRLLPSGQLSLLTDTLGAVNGIEVSPDNRSLYFSETNTGKVWKYELSPSGDIRNPELLNTFEDHALDGMRCDETGNFWLCVWNKGKIMYLSPSGELLRTVRTRGTRAANIAFGGPNGKTLDVTVQDRKRIEYFKTQSRGRSYLLWRR